MSRSQIAEGAAPSVLGVPGGLIGPVKAMVDPLLLDYVRTAAETAQTIVSVCTGSLILAAARLLDGLEATTHSCFMETLERLGARPVQRRRVESGRILTAVGVSASLDVGLVLAERLTDRGVARILQTVIEYDPEPPFGPVDWKQAEATDLRATLRAEFQRITAQAPCLPAGFFA